MITIQVGNSGTVYSGSAEDLNTLRDQFEHQHFLRFSGLLAPSVMAFVQPKVHQAEFQERSHEGIGENKELCMTSNTASAALLFLMNDKKLFQIVQAVTQCDQIGCFQGRVYRVNPGKEHHDSWHNDIGEHRLVGMSINLSKEPYSGGMLQIRDHASGKIVCEVPNAGSGDAVIFSLYHRLQQRITNVEGTTPKTAFAGWFRAQPDFLSLLRTRSQPVRDALVDQPSSHVLGSLHRSRQGVVH